MKNAIVLAVATLPLIVTIITTHVFGAALPYEGDKMLGMSAAPNAVALKWGMQASGLVVPLWVIAIGTWQVAAICVYRFCVERRAAK